MCLIVDTFIKSNDDEIYMAPLKIIGYHMK